MALDSTLEGLSNIDERGVERRLSRSVVAFGFTLAAVVALRGLGAPPWVFTTLVIPFFGAYMMAYQGLFRT